MTGLVTSVILFFRTLNNRRAGYLVWGVALAFVFIPEILSAISWTQKWIHFVTISSTIGHLEYMVSIVAIAPTLLIVSALYSLVRVPPATANSAVRAVVANSTAEGNPPPPVDRTPGGRLTLRQQPAHNTIETFDQNPVGRMFWSITLTAAAVITAATLAAWWWWKQPTAPPNQSPADFHVGYVLYGLIAAGILLIGLFAVLGGVDAPFPTLFRTIANLEEWTGRHTGNAFGKLAHWGIPIVLLWGLIFLMIHLSFYPWPEIMKLINPTAR